MNGHQDPSVIQGEDSLEVVEFIARMKQWVEDWGERDLYCIMHEDLVYAIAHGLCEVLVLNQKVMRGDENQYLMYRSVIRMDRKYFQNIDGRIAGH